MNDYEDQLLPQMSSAQQRNRLLIEDPDDAYIGGGRQYGGGGQLLPMPRYQGGANAKPLIEEDDADAPQSNSALTDKGKANLAAYVYHQNKVRGLQQPKTPWKRGMPYSQTTLDMFDTSTPYEKKMFGGISNPRQAANLDAEGGARPAPKGFWGKLGDVLTGGGTFKKLFGAKTTDERAVKRQGWKDKRQEMIAANGGKRTWMQALFGAYKKKPSMSARAMGITSSNAPTGESSGWADQLIEASKAGRLGDGGDPFVSEQLLGNQGGQGQAAVDRSFESVPEETTNANAPMKRGALQQLDLKNNEYAADSGGNDNDSIDEEDEEKEAAPYRQSVVKNLYADKDDDESDDEDEYDKRQDKGDFMRNFLFEQILSKKMAAGNVDKDDDD